MRHRRSLTILVSFLLLAVAAAGTATAAVRTSIGMVGGAGIPVGWWADRWNPSQTGEVNVRYEFSSGTGILILTGLGKAFFADLSAEEILDESRLGYITPEFREHLSYEAAQQSGYFKQIPLGFGLYTERLLGGLRTYGSAAMVVYNWKFERSQNLRVEVDIPEIGSQQYSDDWWTEQDGSDLGFQAAVGVLYRIQRYTYVDISLAYHYVNISKKFGALAYWGQPVRTWSGEEQEQAEGAVNFISLRIGFRYGR